MIKSLSSVKDFIKDSWLTHMIVFILIGILLIIPDRWFMMAVGYNIPNYLQFVLLILFILSSVLICFDLIFCKNEERKKDIERKRSLIIKWRNMVNEVIKKQDEDENNTKAAVYLERHKDYYDLKPHLSKETFYQLCRARSFEVGSTISPPLRFILNDIDRLEKEWKLT